MQQEFYFDTSIWLDIHEKRGINGELALNLILKLINDDCKIAYSDLTIKEFKNIGYSNEEINAILSIAKPDNIKRVHIYREQKEEAKKIIKQRDVPEGDALHAILARDNNLQFISRDHDFEQLKDVTRTRKPEDFI